MMKKLFFFVAATLLATSLWAVGVPPQKIDSIPYPVYMENIRYDAETQQLFFDDTYRNDLTADRCYSVRAYFRNAETANIVGLSSAGNYYEYGYLVNIQIGEDPNTHEPHYETTYESSKLGYVLKSVTESNGGAVRVDITELLSSCIAQGYADIHLVIAGSYKDPVRHGYMRYETQFVVGESGLNNYIDISLPKIHTCDIEYNNYGSYEIRYGEELVLEYKLQGIDLIQYTIERSTDNGRSWYQVDAGYVSTLSAREGRTLEYKYLFNKSGEFKSDYRIVAECGGEKVIANLYSPIEFRYPYAVKGYQPSYDHNAGETETLNGAPVCQEYRFDSELPVKQTTANNGQITITYPACPMEYELAASGPYTVKFMNADYTLLKTEEVMCGESATAPTNPSMPGATFKGWSVEFTNVQKDLVVWAQYDMGANYTFTSKMTSHVNEVYPVAYGFANSDNRAMVGDKITFQATVKIPTSGTLFFQEGVYDLNGNLNWNDGVSVASLSANEQKTVTRSADVAWYPSSLSERMWVRRAAYRFYIGASGNTIYSDGYEFDVYYQQTVNTGGNIIVMNQTGQVASDNPAKLFARYGDTIYVEKILGNNGCLHLARTLKPTGYFDSGLTEDKKAFYICPGETEVIDVTVPNYAIVFDEAYPTTHYDFRSQGLGQYNAFYAEVEPCGGRVLPPTEPTSNGQVFLGWKNKTSDAYADDAYLNIPAVDGINLIFSADWEEIPEAPLYTVTFKDWDGSTLKEEQVREGENATPPVPSGRTGYHFVGWDKPYTTITAHTIITAQYGQDEIYHTVVFLDWDNTELATLQVLDGEAAQAPITHRTGYAFQYWINTATSTKEDISAIWSDLTVKAYYTSTEGFEQIPVPQEKARKYLINGAIYIVLPDGKVYNIQGQVVR